MLCPQDLFGTTWQCSKLAIYTSQRGNNVYTEKEFLVRSPFGLPVNPCQCFIIWQEGQPWQARKVLQRCSTVNLQSWGSWLMLSVLSSSACRTSLLLTQASDLREWKTSWQVSREQVFSSIMEDHSSVGIGLARKAMVVLFLVGKYALSKPNHLKIEMFFTCPPF